MEQDLWRYLKEAAKPIVLYGMGNGADKIISVLKEYNIEFKGIFASDGFVRNKTFHGLPVESYQVLKERFSDMIVLLCFGTHLIPVMENVRKIAAEQELYAPEVPVIGGGLFNLDYYLQNKTEFHKIRNILADERSRYTFDNIIRYKISGKPEYLFDCQVPFDEPYESFLKLDKESFLDLGAYNGDTVLDFVKRNPDYTSIIAVEPDRKTFKKLTANTENLENTRCYNLCISDFTGKGQFTMNAGRNSVVGRGEETDFSTVDDLVEGRDISVIKMDVEGEELRAITGAQKTILKHRPKMIISAYHRTEDFLTLPQKVLEIRGDYKIYMRHFPSLPAWDTVYYFV